MGAQASVGLIETYFIGKLGTAALTGMALVFPIVMLMQMLSAGAFGGAMASAVILGMIVTLFPQPGERAKAIGAYSFCQAAGGTIGLLAGGAIEAGGRLPLNPHGGQLGEAYIHGMNGIAEAVRQVRGTAVNQIPGDGPVLVTAGTGVPTSGLILAPA